MASQLDPGETAPSVVCLKNTYYSTINSNKTCWHQCLYYFSYCETEWSSWSALTHILPLQLWNALPTVTLIHAPQFANLPVAHFHQTSALGLVLKDVFVTLDTSSVLASVWKKTHVAAAIMEIIIRWGNWMWNHLGQQWFVIVSRVLFFVKLTCFFSAWI